MLILPTRVNSDVFGDDNCLLILQSRLIEGVTYARKTVVLATELDFLLPSMSKNFRPPSGTYHVLITHARSNNL